MGQSASRCQEEKERGLCYKLNPSDIDSLECGVLLEFKKKAQYSHWAVYIGNGKMCHLTGSMGAFPIALSGKRVEATICVEDVNIKWWSDVYVNCSGDCKWMPYCPREIVKRALSKISDHASYNLKTCNCEHFAHWCRYGMWHSQQADSLEHGKRVAGLYAAFHTPVLVAAGAAAGSAGGPAGILLGGAIGAGHGSFSAAGAGVGTYLRNRR